MKKDEFSLPHITLEANESTRTRRVGRSIISPLYHPIGQKRFIKEVNRMINSNTVKLDSSEKTYFLINLTLPHYNIEVRALIKRLKLKVKSVLSEFQILVSIDKQNLIKYIKGKIHKSTLKVIKDINQLESSYKIGESLKKLMLRDVAKIKAFSIFIQLINMDTEERKKCIESLKEALYSAESIIFYENSVSISCVCSTSRIKKVAQIPFVKLITESPKTQNIEISEEVIFPNDEIVFTENIRESTPICILDSGTSDFLDPFTIHKDTLSSSLNYEDNIGHGSSVASVALFGEQLLEKKKILTANTKIISFKIIDEMISKGELNLEEAIKKAVKKYKHLTPIFNLSCNYLEDMSLELRKEMVNKIDNFIQKENVILVNSVGNIPLDQGYSLKDIYPKYLTELNVLCPAEGRYVFSVGSLCIKSLPHNVIYSRHTRIGIPPYVQNEELNKHEFFKPEIHSFGGNGQPNEEHYKNIITNDLCFPVLNNRGDLTMNAGTSFSAPLISLCLSRIHHRFKDQLKNSETFKAILLNQCVKNECEGLTTFSLFNTKDVGLCTDGIYLNFEGESLPHEKSEEKKSSKIIKCKKIKFYVPKEAKDINVIISHSNNYSEGSLEKMNTKVILKLKKPSGTVCKQNYGSLNKKSAITYANYGFSRNYEGEWEAELHIETSEIPSELFNNIKVRYGVSLKINLKDNKNIKKIYDQILEKSESAIRQVQKTPLDITQKMPQIIYSREELPNIIQVTH